MDFDYQPILCFCMTTAASDLTECQTESEKHYNDTVSVMLPVYTNSVDLRVKLRLSVSIQFLDLTET